MFSCRRNFLKKHFDLFAVSSLLVRLMDKTTAKKTTASQTTFRKPPAWYSQHGNT